MCQRYPHLEWRREGESSPFSCNTWKCPECEPGKRNAVVEICSQWARRYDLTRAVTLTLNPETVTPAVLQPFMDPGEDAGDLMEDCIKYRWRKKKRGIGGRWSLTYAGGTEDQRRALRIGFLRYINYLWNKVRTRLRTRYRIEYIRVTELHDDAVRPHLHLLVSAYMDQEYWRQIWTAAGGGGNLRIKRIKGSISSATHYMTKYLTKAAHGCDPDQWPKGARRICVSRSISLTLNPDEKEHVEDYLSDPSSQDRPCLGGHTPESLEGCRWTQCKDCLWKKRRVCHWRSPWSEPWNLYDSQRGILLMPVKRTQEEEIHRLWTTIGRRQAEKDWEREGWISSREYEDYVREETADLLSRETPGFQVDSYAVWLNSQTVKQSNREEISDGSEHDDQAAQQ